MRTLIALFLSIVLATAATAQGWRPFFFGFGAGGGTIVTPTCNGVIDLSVGCQIPGMGP